MVNGNAALKEELTSDNLSQKLQSAQQALEQPNAFEHRDTSVRPQDDMYRHVNGKWLDTIEIPADKTSYGTFVELKDKVDDDLDVIMKALLSSSDLDPDAKQIVDLHRSFMDTDSIEKKGLEPIEPLLKAIDQIESRESLIAQMAYLHWIGIQLPIGIGVGTDSKVLDAHALYASQSGLGLPDRDYYLKEDEKFAAYQQGYRDYITKLFKLAGIKSPSIADSLYAIESEIAKNQVDKVTLRDREASYNKISVEELMSQSGQHFNWRDFLKLSHLESATEVITPTPSYLSAFDKMFDAVSIDDWKLYLKFKTLNHFASYLPEEISQAKFDFYGRTLSGVEVRQPREKRALRMIDSTLGESMGKLYVAKHFPPEAKEHLLRMLGFVKLAFKEGLEQNTWMDASTKAKALEKLDAMGLKVGYPDEFEDYSAIVIEPENLIQNVINAAAFESRRNSDKLHQRVDKNEWAMLPHEVNAYNMPSQNEICFPAGILQAPFFSLENTDAQNYGAIASIIGHEISHGFDDQGRKYDAHGQLSNWWTKQDAQAFEQRTAKLVAQYDGYEPIEGTCVNGRLTLGENIADLTGLRMALRAYQLAHPKQDEPMPEGLTPSQSLFMSWGTSWRTKMREDALQAKLLTDPHSPGEYRCNGILSNLQPFYEAFDVKPEDGMFLDEAKRTKLWL